jgi:transcriptional regulator with XRE-family HTH domain
MEDRDLIDKIRRLKEERRYTLYELSKRLDVQVAPLERWLKTNRINRVYAQLVKERLKVS